MKKKLFLVTRTPKGLYNFIINPCVADAEKKTKKKLILKKFKNKFHLTAVLFTLKNIFNLIIFDKHRLAKLNFNEVQIGRYIIAEIYSKPNSYNSIIVFLGIIICFFSWESLGFVEVKLSLCPSVATAVSPSGAILIKTP